jgi:HSP20 family protein
MANLIRRRNESEPNRREMAPRGSASFGNWDPFRVMGELMRWDPFREMSPLGIGEFNPAFDVQESKDSYAFIADVPGVREQDLEITVTPNTLTIGGKRMTEQTNDGDRVYYAERSFGEFHRTFALPEGADPDSAQADFKDGVLRVTVKKRPEVQPRKITVGQQTQQPGAKA